MKCNLRQAERYLTIRVKVHAVLGPNYEKSLLGRAYVAGPMIIHTM